MKNIHVLPTSLPSTGYILGKCIKELSDVKIGQFVKIHYMLFSKEYFQPHNIYITDNSEVKDGDYVLSDNSISALYLDGAVNTASMLAEGQWKKVILTDNKYLIANGVQEISEEFLQWYVNNSSCEFVETIQMCKTCGAEGKEGDSYCERSKECNRGWAGDEYKIIIPSEPHKLDKGSEKFLESTDMTILVGRPNKNNFYKQLVEYFETTPREKVLEDWNKSVHLNNVGPTIDEFLDNTNTNLERFKSLVTDTDTEIFKEAKHRVDNHERLKAEKKELFNRLVELNEAGKKYAKVLDKNSKEDFINGAKSNEAKNYWYTIFKIEQNGK